MHKTRLTFLVAAISLIAGACSIAPITEPTQTFVTEQYPAQWHAKGRFTYQGSNERQSGQFDWQQDGSHYQVRLFGPFGAGSVKIIGNTDAVEIESGGQSYLSSEPDLLLFELTGMHLPIRELSRWLTGDASTRENKNTVWQVAYDDFENLGSYSLPTRIDLENETSSMRIAVSEWSLDLAN